MRTLLCMLIAVLFGGAALAAQQPPIIALPTLTSVEVKVVDPANQEPGSCFCMIKNLKSGEYLVNEMIDSTKMTRDALGHPTFKLEGLTPKPWTLENPELYLLSLMDQAGRKIGDVRFGFRTFEIKDKKFYLNGKPIFLRGLPINPPGRDLPTETGKDKAFIDGYLKLVKSSGANIIRTEGQDWLDACDELGLLAFQGNYASPPGAEKHNEPPSVDAVKDFYRQMVIDLANHPSVVIYILTNETDYDKYGPFLEGVNADIKQIDPTRPVIGNAGFGRGQGGEIWDYHQYRGWYYHSFLKWYGEFNELLPIADSEGKPFTMTECVGAYTSDAGLFQTFSKQLAPMLRWIGPAEDVKTASLEYQAELTRQIVEIARRERTDKTGLSGIMPFTYFFGWSRAKKADDLFIKPCFDALKVVYQPVLLSPECWSRNVYSGSALKMNLFVINDDDSGRDVAASTAKVDVLGKDGKPVASGSVDFGAVPYYGSASKELFIAIPADLAKGYYTVSCSLTEGGKEISRNSFEITVAPKEQAKTTALVALFDPKGTTSKAFSALGVKTTELKSLNKLPKNSIVVIGEEAGAYPEKKAVSDFLARGGRILVLRQTPENWNSDWLAVKLAMGSTNPNGANPLAYIHEIGGNTALFNDLTDRDLRIWNELGRDKSNIPDVFPVLVPFKPDSFADLKSCRIWAATDHLLSRAAVVEVFSGKGSVILSQFACASRVESDPIAAKILLDLVDYAIGAEHPSLLDLSKPIKWDLSAFRSGAFSSIVQGFFPHSKTYSYRGQAKGGLDKDHSIDGCTLVGENDLSVNGFIKPEPDIKGEGYGRIYGELKAPAKKFVLRMYNSELDKGTVTLKINGQAVGEPVTLAGNEARTQEWPVDLKSGSVEVELVGTRSLVITESSFE